jgi:mono/diheme cytochrome c family protein
VTFVALTAFLVVSLGAAPGRQTASPRADIEAGRKVYETRKCGTCHMVAGRGNIRFPLDRVGARLTAADLKRWLTDTAEMERALPKQPAVRMSEWMTTNKKMSDRDREVLVAYLRSLK